MDNKEKPKKRRNPRSHKNKKSLNRLYLNNMVIKLGHVVEENNIVKPYTDDYYHLTEQTNYSSICWNYCHSFEEMVYGLPLKYVSGIFYTYGDFCSLECASRYALEYFDNYHEIISLVKLYNNNSKVQLILLYLWHLINYYLKNLEEQWILKNIEKDFQIKIFMISKYHQYYL